jgi:hypothetical protein
VAAQEIAPPPPAAPEPTAMLSFTFRGKQARHVLQVTFGGHTHTFTNFTTVLIGHDGNVTSDASFRGRNTGYRFDVVDGNLLVVTFNGATVGNVPLNRSGSISPTGSMTLEPPPEREQRHRIVPAASPDSGEMTTGTGSEAVN